MEMIHCKVNLDLQLVNVVSSTHGWHQSLLKTNIQNDIPLFKQLPWPQTGHYTRFFQKDAPVLIIFIYLFIKIHDNICDVTDQAVTRECAVPSGNIMKQCW